MKTKMIHIKIDEKLHKKIKNLAKERSMPITQLLIQSTLALYPELLKDDKSEQTHK